MKDIKDLKENECIHIRNKKEAKGIAKLCKNDMPLIGYRVYEDRTTYYPSTEQYADTEYSNCSKEKIIPASKFLKPSKKELLKRIEALDVKIDLLSASIKSIHKPFNLPNLEVDFEKVEAKSELEVGNWYTLKDNDKCFVNYNNELLGLGYGFDSSGEWSNEVCIEIAKLWRLATETEVKEALIKEAERRGFKRGVEFYDVHTKSKHIAKGVYYCEDSNDLRSEERWGGCIYFKGKWAEIIEQPKEEIDFSQVGLIVESESKSVVVFTNGFANYKDGQFSGIVIHSTNAFFKVKDVYDTFYTKEFKLRKEPITISNEIN